MSKTEPLVSAIIIAKNEEARIASALFGVGFCDETIVVDNNSADRTAEIAKQNGARVLHRNSHSFSDLRNEAAEVARGTWILYIDADEEISSELARQIQDAVNHSHYAGYHLIRSNRYLGKPWPYKEKMLRLFKKEALIRWDGQVHETARINGDIGELSAPLYHDTHRSLEEMVDKTNQWSEIEADLRFSSHHPSVTWWRLLRVMGTGFWISYIDQKGYKAGVTGIIESLYQAFSMFVTYAKLWERQQKNLSTK